MIQSRLPKNRHESSADRNANWNDQRFYPNLLFRDDGVPAPLINMFQHDSNHGSSLFLLCNGPSLVKTDLTQLHRRGVMSMGMNNGWLIHRPTLWCCTDTPNRFADVGWKDPGIMKLVPAGHVQSKLGVMMNGRKTDSAFRVGEMPNTFFFRRNSHFQPHTFFDETSVSWGCDEHTADASGVSGNRSTMLCCLRLAHHLGFANVYLVGADFNMPKKGNVYAFTERASAGARESNNNKYDNMLTRFDHLQTEIERLELKFRIINVTPESKITSFPTLTFDAAIDAATAECEKIVPTDGWYKK